MISRMKVKICGAVQSSSRIRSMSRIERAELGKADGDQPIAIEDHAGRRQLPAFFLAPAISGALR